MEDLSQISSAECSQAISRLTDQLIMDPIDLSVGPLFEVRLLKLHDDEHVLIAVMEHMISDGFSMNIFLSELFTAYTQATKGQAFSLPEVQIQFADYALEQKSAHLGWLKRHDHYWQERLPRLQRLRFPVDDSVSSAAPPGWGMVPFQISGGTKAALRDWCRARKTTLVMSVFTSFVAAALRWCNATEGTFQYQTDGRSSPRTENSIGFFAWPLYLAVSLREQDSFTDLLNRITQEYCQAYERADHCFYESRALRPEFAKSCAFNWVPQQGTQSEGSSPGHSDVTVTWSPVAFEHPMLKRLNRDNEPVLLLYETDDEIDAGIYFPRARFSEPYIERFAQTVLRFLQHQHSYPEARIKDVPTL
jgi:hypothetical protein